MIIVSGNLSFLNWLTIVPAIFSFDDLHLAGLFSRADRRAACSRITTTVAVEEHSKEEKKTNVGVAIEAEVSNGVTVACEDDVIGGPQLGSVARADGSCQGSHDGLPTSARRWLRATANVLLVVLVVKGSLPVVKNMAGVGVGQVMNTSFDRRVLLMAPFPPHCKPDWLCFTLEQAFIVLFCDMLLCIECFLVLFLSKFRCEFIACLSCSCM